ncbi:unnamed protein product [Allacma fusca]|uniref:Uncharacterized protein n=1 Tax=Allacma fusca TaxID=39272 RepID=A0A8J2PAN1_9HEXA|nr:unnamed protein product [Allacma fusca]
MGLDDSAKGVVLFESLNKPGQMETAVSEGLGKVLIKGLQNASQTNTVPLELDRQNQRVTVIVSAFKWTKFWLNFVWILAEAMYVVLRLTYVMVYNMEVSVFQLLYTSGLAVVYSAGAITMVLTFMRRYEFQDLINAVDYFNQRGGANMKHKKRLSVMYLLLKYLPIGVYCLGALCPMLFLTSKTSPCSFYSIMDPSYRDSWYIILLHCLHEVIVPAKVCTAFLFPVLWFIGFMELVKLKMKDTLESNKLLMSPDRLAGQSMFSGLNA